MLPGSCKKDSICACGVENPQTNLIWLKDKLDIRFCSEVYSYFFKNVEYIILEDCPDVIDGQLIFFDCHGTKICESGGAAAGDSTCFLPVGFSFENYEQYKKLIYTKIYSD